MYRVVGFMLTDVETLQFYFHAELSVSQYCNQR